MLSEAEFLEEIPTVISASRLAQAPEDAPGVVTVISRDLIRASGARNIAEVFRLVPGVVVGYSRGGQAVVAYHGLSGSISQRMQVLVDGRSLYSPYSFGGVDWNSLSIGLDDIDRIEVFRGSNSASYGANAFLGVANIITRTALESRGVGGGVVLGSNGIQDGQLRLGGSVSALNWALSAGIQSDFGLSERADNFSKRYFNFRGDLRPGVDDEISFSLGATASRLGLGTPGKLIDPARFEEVSSYSGLLRWRRQLAPGNEFAFTASVARDLGEDAYFIPVTANSGITVDYARQAEKLAIEYQHQAVLSDMWRAVWGLDYREEWVVASQLFNTYQRQETHAARAYLSAEYRPVDFLTGNFGLLYEREALAGEQFAPRIGLNWKALPGHRLGIGYSTAFRLPSLFEQRSDWRFSYLGQTIDIRYLSRGGLAAEKIKATEITYVGNWRKSGLGIDLRLFHEEISDLVTQQKYALPPGTEVSPDSGAYDLRNNGALRIDGVEYQVRWDPSERWQAVLGSALLRPRSSTAFLSQSIPNHTISLLGTYRIGSAYAFHLGYYQQGSIRWIGETDQLAIRRQLNLGFERLFRGLGVDHALTVRGQWVLGDQKEEFRSGQQVPPLLWFGWKVSY